MINPASSSSPLTKFFEAGFSSTTFRNDTEKKVYLAASIVFGILTAGLVHAAYYGIKEINHAITKNDPDDQPFNTGFNTDGTIETQKQVQESKGEQQKVQESKFKVSCSKTIYNSILENTLLFLTQTTSQFDLIDTKFPTGISLYETLTNDKYSIATISKDLKTGKLYIELKADSLGQVSTAGTFTVNGHTLTQEKRRVDLEYGENTIQLNGKTIFTFTLPKPE